MKTKPKQALKGTRAAHTPGPWVAELNEANNTFFVGQPHGPTVALISSTARGHIEANARLIARAPEMEIEIERLREVNKDLLECVKLAHVFLDSLPEGWLGKTVADIGALNDFYIKSRAAIEKAEKA